MPGLFLKRIGPERMAHLEAVRSLLDCGVTLALGSDAIGGAGNPFLGLMLAVLHPGMAACTGPGNALYSAASMR